MEGVGESGQRSGRSMWARACLVTVALAVCACETEEIQQLKTLSRLAQLERAEKMELIANREERKRELQVVEHALRLHCPPNDETELRSRLTQAVGGADVSVLRESGEGRVLRIQGTGAESDLVDTVEALGKSAPFLSLERLSIRREAWSMDLAPGPACPTLEADAATVTRYPLPPQGALWPGTSRKLRAEILAMEHDIQRWESTVLAGGVARLNSRLALFERRRKRQLDGIGYLTGQLPLLKGLLDAAVEPALTLSRKEDGVWLLEGGQDGLDGGWVDRLRRAGYRLTAERSGSLVLRHVSKLTRTPEGG
ncbi:hypothetical protein [Corallococcus exiguus]|uniref:hypothetical protein n=1 Tax=Corallococcus exiguus TaxID=83462 RepID=UPI0015614D13|nr:hypothetical protein [Corallococcus exiguus]NRD49215.1 hypothetical protein [Corallococcus exiguus]